VTYLTPVHKQSKGKKEEGKGGTNLAQILV